MFADDTYKGIDCWTKLAGGGAGFRTMEDDSGEYEDIDEDGYNWTRGEYSYNWDDSEYKREREEEEREEKEKHEQEECEEEECRREEEEHRREEDW